MTSIAPWISGWIEEHRAACDERRRPARRRVGAERDLICGLERFPDLHFEPLDVLVGVDSVTLSYISVGGRRAAEVMTLGPDGRVTRVLAHYRDPD